MYAMFRHHESSDLEAVLSALKRGVGVAGGGMFFEHTPVNTGFIRIHVGLQADRVDAVVAKIKASKK